MNIERKIVLSNAFIILLMILIGVMGYQGVNVILAKLRFVEIADDLNATFLELRLSEKNYFLYRDERALGEIAARLGTTESAIARASVEMGAAIGPENLAALRSRVRAYGDALQDLRGGIEDEQQSGARLRAKGQELREFSKTMTDLERKAVNRIITTSEKTLFVSFGVFLLMASAVSHAISRKIVRSLRQIGQLANAISQGNFQRITGIQARDETGAVIAAINSMSEELEKREEQLIQSKKLASMGVLTAGVAHELTNPVNNISMIAQTLLELHDQLPGEKRVEMIGQIEAETDRIKNIVRNLLDFSKPQGTKPGRTKVNAIVRRTMNLVQNMLHVSDIVAELRLGEGLPPVRVDEHQIQQVLVNLVVNAVQAMQPKGRLTIATQSGRDGLRVEISVRDTGKGIAPEYLPHIFDPFFSTKGVEGTGLGLSVSYGIIKNHQGDIFVESELGKGSTFTVSLPSY